MRTASYQIELISPRIDGVENLLRLSDEYIYSLYPPEICHLDYSDELEQANVRLVGAHQDQKLAGMGAIRMLQDDNHYAEVRRLFVDPQFRGQGIAKAIMLNLEQIARAQRITIMRLESGPLQPEANELYYSLGFVDRSPYSNHKAHPLSTFMEKELTL